MAPDVRALKMDLTMSVGAGPADFTLLGRSLEAAPENAVNENRLIARVAALLSAEKSYVFSNA